MRFVFDTNVYISAFIVPGSKSELAYRLAVRGVFDLAVSGAILSELKDKLGSRFGYSEQEIRDVEERHLLALGSYGNIGIMIVSELLYTFPEMP